MRIIPDLTRDIILYVEEHSVEFDNVKVLDMSKYLIDEKGYTIDQVLYHVLQCRLSGFFYNCHIPGHPDSERVSYIHYSDAFIDCLTPKGHNYLENVREQTNWEKTKKAAGKVGSYALPVLINIASGLAQTAIQTALFH